ncbi:MAG: T9SS type A sorting domain-containing protein [Chitinivibrionales bacterium]|nr:T9SS type A sorting domain-containing protein [Chitinivibrionales bacterium]
MHPGRNKGIQLRWQSPSQYYSYVPQSQLLPPGSVSAKSDFRPMTASEISVRRIAGKLHIATGTDKLSRIELITLNGRLVDQIKCRGNALLPTDNLAQGAYMARLITPHGVATRRFIIR